jgi:hypothetical protein
LAIVRWSDPAEPVDAVRGNDGRDDRDDEERISSISSSSLSIVGISLGSSIAMHCSTKVLKLICRLDEPPV